MCQMCIAASVGTDDCAFSGVTYAAVTEGATDAGAGTTTNRTITVGDSFSGNLSSAGDRDSVRVYLEAGETYEFTLQGGPSGVGTLADPYLRLYNASGTLIAYNDDSGSLESRIGFTATTSGYYYVEAGAYSSTATGTYRLTTSVDEPAAPATLDELSDYLVNGYWADTGQSARRWNTTASTTITVDLHTLTAEAQQLARWALQAWSAVANLRFVETTGVADIEFDDTNAEGTTAYTSSVTSGGYITSSYILISDSWVDNYGTSIDSYSFQTYMHEIGHALGLGHQGGYNGNASYPGDTTFANDSWQMSIMSYFDQDDNTTVNASYARYMTTMMADIVAIQSMYGASNASAGNSVYGVNTTQTGYMGLLWDALASGGTTANYTGDPVAITIYDRSGRDTIDVSYASGNQRLSLVAETFSDIDGLIGNLGIARGTVIEVGITGSGNDTITGNSVANELRGGAGNDSLSGGGGNDSLFGDAGNDTLYGGAGADTMQGGAGNDRYLVDATTDRVIDIASGGTDTAVSSVTFTLNSTTGSRNVENLTLSGTANINGTGNDLNNSITGNSGNNVLAGGLGADRLRGGAGNDSFLFNTALTNSNADRILDFSVANDTIRLDDAVFTSLSTGQLAANAFTSNTSGFATDAADRIIYETDTGRVWYDADGQGGGGRVLVATLATGLALTNADFLVV